MSQVSTPLETSQGYAPPSVTQFSIFLDNRVGKLLDVIEVLDECTSAQICALTVHEASDFAVVRIITNYAPAACSALKERGFAFAETKVVVVELEEGHELAGLCLGLLGAELSIRFAYPLLLRPNGTPTIAMAVDDLQLAGQILRKKGFKLLGEGDLPRPMR